MNWKELKQKIQKLNFSESPIVVETFGSIVDEKRFVESHIVVVDKYSQKSPRTYAHNEARQRIGKPHFDRLLAYYLMKTQL